MKRFILGLIILLCVSSTVYAEERVKMDFSNELCQCLLYHAHRNIHLQYLDYSSSDEGYEEGEADDIVTIIMNTCYPIHFLQVRTYAPNDEIAVDMMHDHAVEHAYEELAEAAVKFIMEQQ